MRKYVILEIESKKPSIKNFLNFVWWLSRDTLVFLGCIGLAILMFTS